MEKTLGQLLRDERTKHGWSLRDVEEKTGIHNAHLSQDRERRDRAAGAEPALHARCAVRPPIREADAAGRAHEHQRREREAGDQSKAPR